MKTLDITVCMVRCDTGPEYINIFDTVEHNALLNNTQRRVYVCMSTPIRRITDKMFECVSGCGWWINESMGTEAGNRSTFVGWQHHRTVHSISKVYLFQSRPSTITNSLC